MRIPNRRLSLAITCGIAMLAASRVAAAINPEEFKRSATTVVKLREIARVVDRNEPAHLERITIVGEVVQSVRRDPEMAPDQRVVLIDYTVDLARREAERKAYTEKNRGLVGRQFMYEPDPPQLDSNDEFWAYLAPLGGRSSNPNRYAGSVAATPVKTGPVFVPAAGQYSWDPPRPAASGVTAVGETGTRHTGTVRTGIMAIGGETTGILLDTDAGPFELDAGGNREIAARLEALNGRRVTILGPVRIKNGVEVKNRRIIDVSAVRAEN